MGTTTPQFDLLPPRVQADILRDVVATGNPNPTVSFMPTASQKIAVSGPVFEPQPADVAGPLTTTKAPAADAAPSPTAQAGYQPTMGAMGALAATFAGMKPPTIQDALAQFAPTDDSRDTYLALARGFGSATKTGNFGEQLGNAAENLQVAHMERQKLSMQYLPVMLSQLAAQQKMQMDLRTRAVMAQYLPSLTAGGQPAPSAPGAPGSPQDAVPAGGAGPTLSAGPTAAPAPVSSMAAAPAPAPAPAAPSQPAIQQVQNAWQKEGFQYPLSQTEALAILGAADPMAAFMDLAKKHSEPTGPALLAIQAGMQPGTPEFQKYMQDAARRATYIAPVAGRAGGYIIYADGRKEFNPQVPEGMVGRQNPQTGRMEFTQDPDIIAGISAAEAAKLGGKNTQTLAPPEQSVFNKDGTYTPRTVAQAVDAANGAPSSAAPAPAPAPGAVPAPQGVGAPAGLVQGQLNAQNELSDKYKALQTQAAQAQTTTSYLKEIQTLAAKAAVGPLSDKIQYLNSLLSAVGASERASDAVTANNLIDKYGSQIVSRLGTGSLGTDAARSILQAAYPNSHMTQDAINQASENLIGANEMVKAKLAALAPHGNARDPVGYQQKEQVFDRVSDPALWSRLAQYKALTPGSDAAKSFLAKCIQADPTFMQKAAALNGIGAY